MNKKVDADYSRAYKSVIKALKKAYLVRNVYDISNAMADSKELNYEEQIMLALENINSGDNVQIEGAAGALASIIFGGDDDIERGSIFCELVATFAISVKYDTQNAARELAHQMFGENKGIDFEVRLENEESGLLAAYKKRQENEAGK